MRIVNASRHISVVPLGFWSYGDELVVPFGLIRQVSRNYCKDKTRQNAENKQTFDLTVKIELNEAPPIVQNDHQFEKS